MQAGDHDNQVSHFPVDLILTPTDLQVLDDRPSSLGAIRRLPSPPESSGLDRVILIDRCSGVQVGQDNDQYSVYQVTLPTVAIESGQELAERLLSQETPWSDDLFSHDAPHIRYSTPGGGFRSAFRDTIAGPAGDTLVIVRSSRGIQVGDHNVQRNQFRIRVTDISVRADHVGMTPEREALISRLRQDPGDRAAARSLAEDVERSASIDLAADLTGEITRTVSPPQIDDWPGEVHDRFGIQIGDLNRASVTVNVTPFKWDSTALERHIRQIATSLDEPAEPAEPAIHWPWEL